MKTLGPQIRAIREAQNITLKALSGTTRIWITRLKGIEAGTVDPKVSELRKICQALDMRIVIECVEIKP